MFMRRVFLATLLDMQYIRNEISSNTGKNGKILVGSA